jgi:hypothetical protein
MSDMVRFGLLDGRRAEPRRRRPRDGVSAVVRCGRRNWTDADSRELLEFRRADGARSEGTRTRIAAIRVVAFEQHHKPGSLDPYNPDRGDPQNPDRSIRRCTY